MFSYNWAVQEQVKAARSEVAAAGVPTWLDIDGGMQSDIYDSMARGVSNAACVVCFMTQKYQDSANCALELKVGLGHLCVVLVRCITMRARTRANHELSLQFAKQTGVPIVAVMMEAPDSTGRPWQAGGWLGIITAGSLW